jgi:hypothetical protein
VGNPEIGAFLDPLLVDEDRAVFEPQLHVLGAPVHGLDDRGLALCGAEQLAQPAPAERVLRGDARDEAPTSGRLVSSAAARSCAAHSSSTASG